MTSSKFTHRRETRGSPLICIVAPKPPIVPPPPPPPEGTMELILDSGDQWDPDCELLQYALDLYTTLDPHADPPIELTPAWTLSEGEMHGPLTYMSNETPEYSLCYPGIGWLVTIDLVVSGTGYEDGTAHFEFEVT